METPAGTESLTTTVVASSGPLFVAVIVYVRSCPTFTGVGEPTLVIDISAPEDGGFTVVGSLSESSLGVGSVSAPVTEAVLVTEGTAPERTFTTRVMSDEVLGAMGPGLVQVTVWPFAE